MLIVFGGVAGLERAVDDCEQLEIPSSKTPFLFDAYLNACTGQGSRTIRTEEAVVITLAMLRPHIQRKLSQT